MTGTAVLAVAASMRHALAMGRFGCVLMRVCACVHVCVCVCMCVCVCACACHRLQIATSVTNSHRELERIYEAGMSILGNMSSNKERLKVRQPIVQPCMALNTFAVSVHSWAATHNR